jgi:hypothetical protein
MSGAKKAKTRPKRAKHSKPPAERCEQIKAGIKTELRQIRKTNALLIATQFAANHECDFDVSDAVAVIAERVEQHIERLDRLCLEVSA